MRQTEIIFGRSVYLVFFGWIAVLQPCSVIADTIGTVEEIFWNGSSAEFASALQNDLKGLSARERERRALRYWRELVPADVALSDSELAEELSRIIIESSGGSVEGDESENGFFVRRGRDEEEARVEMLRTWILTANPEILPELIGSRLSDERVSRLDLITLDALNTAPIEPTTRLQYLDFWADLYNESENPAFRLIAVAKSNDAVPRSVSALGSESNKGTFATLVARKEAFKEYAQDQDLIIREMASEKLEVFSSGVARMSAEYGYSEDSVEVVLIDEINWGNPGTGNDQAAGPVNALTQQKHPVQVQPVQSVSENQKTESPSFPAWALAVIVVAVLGILILLLRAFLRSRAS